MIVRRGWRRKDRQQNHKVYSPNIENLDLYEGSVDVIQGDLWKETGANNQNEVCVDVN